MPGEDGKDLIQNVQDLIALDPSSISIHALSMKRKSQVTQDQKFGHGGVLNMKRFHRRHLQLEVALEAAAQMLSEAGYEPYYLYKQKDAIGALENVSFAKKEQACRYNVYMMADARSVLALGAGASSKRRIATQVSHLSSCPEMTFAQKKTLSIRRFISPQLASDYISNVDAIAQKKQQLFFER